MNSRDRKSRRREQIANLEDAYIRERLRRGLPKGVPCVTTPELVEAKRAHLRLARLIREKRKHIEGAKT